MKILKNILVTFIAMVVTSFGIYGSYTIYAEDDEPDYYEFVDNSASFFIVKLGYHRSMNNYFNDRLKYLVSLVDDNKTFYNHKDFVMPVGVNSLNYKDEDKCGKTNVSTYCVAMGSLDLYLAYVNNLIAIKGTLQFDDSSSPPVTTSEAYTKLSNRDAEIDNEIEVAKQVMQATVSVYDEFKMAYPMHKKFKDIINNLLKYKIALKKIRFQTAQFPGKFVDATSSECE